MIVLLSPAKRLSVPSKIELNENSSSPQFMNTSRRIMKVLSSKSPRSLQNLQKVNSELAQLNYERNQNWFEQDGKGVYSALDLFDGEVYRGLDYPSWEEELLDYAQNHLLILSGLYGALRPKDLILPYRLEMGTKLQIGRKKNLYDLWGSDIQDYLKEVSGDQVIINLASAEYSKVIKPKQLESRIHEVDFIEDKGNGKEPKSIQVFLKQARGMLAKYILSNRVLTIEGMRSFRDSGYFFDESRSTNMKSVFLRLH